MAKSNRQKTDQTTIIIMNIAAAVAASDGDDDETPVPFLCPSLIIRPSSVFAFILLHCDPSARPPPQQQQQQNQASPT